MSEDHKQEDIQVDYENDEEEVPQMKKEEKEEKEEKRPVTLFIDGFVRPFQIEDVKQLVSEAVAPINTEDHFFMNSIRSFCYVTYKSMEDAITAKGNLEGRQFPAQFGNKLRVRITSITAASMKRERKQTKADESSDKRKKVEVEIPAKTVEKKTTEIVSMDDLFRKTKSRPAIFYKPLTEAEKEAKLRK